jgi:hypothetical protein
LRDGNGANPFEGEGEVCDGDSRTGAERAGEEGRAVAVGTAPGGGAGSTGFTNVTRNDLLSQHKLVTLAICILLISFLINGNTHALFSKKKSNFYIFLHSLTCGKRSF